MEEAIRIENMGNLDSVGQQPRLKSDLGKTESSDP